MAPGVNYFEDFERGQTFEHNLGKTVAHGDNSLFTSLTMNATPLYCNADYANSFGHDSEVVDPLLVFNLVFGMSVQDLSEAGGALLGIEDLQFFEAVYPEETLYATSEVLQARESESRPQQGIVTWRTTGSRPSGDRVVEYERSNLVAKRNPPAAEGDG